MDLSILIVSWNSRFFLERCVDSMYRHPPKKYTFEVIVIDNHSQDDTVAMLRERFPQVRVIENTYNYGFARATNQGYRVSQGRYVMTLNPDTLLSEGTLDALVDFLEAHPCVGLVGPSECYGNFIPAYRSFILSKVSQKINRIFLKNEYTDQSETPTEVQWLWGTGLVCRREALEPDLFFDERTFLYGEEYWLVLRVRKKGYTVYRLPSVKVNHVASGLCRQSPSYAYKARYLKEYTYHILRKRELGVWNAKLNALLDLMEATIVSLPLWIKQVLYPSQKRAVALAEWRAVMKGSWDFLFRGVKYFKKANEEVERFFNEISSQKVKEPV